MRIALIGSHKGGDDDWDGRGSREEFERASEELGRLIARHRYELVVLSDKKKSADRHAAAGYVDEWERLEKPDSRGIRLVRVVGKKQIPFEELRARYPDLVSID